MPDYLWKGRTPSGTIENGEITAQNPAEVQRILRERKIVPTSIRSKPKEITLPFLQGRISNRSITIFTTYHPLSMSLSSSHDASTFKIVEGV